MTGSDDARPQAEPAFRPRPCPICSKLAVKAYRPFCSVRCKNIDLNRWFSGVYAVPGEPADSEDER
jgi:endogenous inhibitor of DNA gyrase (YacG/DUF329 family)